jgi:hypothetical protein
MRYCFFGKSVLFIQERKRNRFGLFVCLSILGILGLRGVNPSCRSFERNPQPETPSSSARALPAPLQLLRGSGALPGVSGRPAAWGRPDGVLDTYPAPPHTHSHTLTLAPLPLHTFPPPLPSSHTHSHTLRYTHTSLLTERACAPA